MQVVVAQKGTRERLLVARALHSRGMLAQLIIDWYSPIRGWTGRKLGSLPLGPLARAFNAFAEDLPRDRVKVLWSRGLQDRMQEKRAARSGNIYEFFLRSDEAFARHVAGLCLPPHELFFCYAYASLEAMTAERERGKIVVLDQIDPGPREHEIIQEEAKQWPQYTSVCHWPNKELAGRVRTEWDLAHVIIVNSEWSKNSIVVSGANVSKISVLPLGYDAPARPARLAPSRTPCKVLWVGRVTLQKGIQYLVEAARLLQREPVCFEIAGDTDVPAATLAGAPANVRFRGKVSEGQLAELYRHANVFLLPTLSDGFALTQLETLGWGVPIIATPNCGRVTIDGETGFVIPPRDPAAIAEAIQHFMRDPGLSERMAPRCVARGREFSTAKYAERLVNVLSAFPKAEGVRV